MSKRTLELFNANPILREMSDNAEAKSLEALDLMSEDMSLWSVLLQWQDRDPFVFTVYNKDAVILQAWAEHDTDIKYEGPFDLAEILQAMGISAHDLAEREAKQL